MSKEMKLIPELRFPEFIENGKWDNLLISKIGETVNGLSGKRGSDFGNGKPYVQYKQVFDKSFIDFSECGKVKVDGDENQNQLKLGDILFTTSSETSDEVGFASVIIDQPKEPTYLNSFCFILRPKELDVIYPSFARYLFHSPIYRKSVSAIAQGSTRYNLSKSSFLKLRVPLPSPQEQQKIAACLSSLDELIAAHTDKLNALKDHKKGLMQILFPQEGETVPKVRFPEFEEDGEWVIVQLHQILSESRLGGNYRNGVNENGKPLIKMGNISRGSIDISTLSFTSKEEELNSEDVLSYGDLLFNTRNTLELVGKVAIWRNELDKAFYNSNIMKLIFNTDLISSNFFMNYLLNTELMIKKIRSIATGTTSVAAVYTKDLLNLELPICRLQEQQKIASCLLAVDDLITAQQEKIDQLQQHKKGLMQGLFPNPSAISN